jgi:hypothetical protein
MAVNYWLLLSIERWILKVNALLPPVTKSGRGQSFYSTHRSGPAEFEKDKQSVKSQTYTSLL